MRLNLVMMRNVSNSTKRYSNLPDRYIKRSMKQVEWENPDYAGPNYQKGKIIQRDKFYFGEHRPWTQEFFKENEPGMNKPDVAVLPLRDWSFFKGDRVEVLVGKDKGKQGLVNYIVEERNWVYVEGLHCKYEYVAAEDDYPGMLIKKEKPLLVTSDVALVDPADNLPTEVEWRFTEGGERVRVSVRSDRILPIPGVDEETLDYKTKATYKEKPKDTAAEEAMKETFTPKFATFEMDIMKSMGIEETRKPKKSFWYFVEPLV